MTPSLTFHISLISRPNSGWLNVQNSGIGNPKQQRMCFVFWIDWIYWPWLEQIGSKEHQRISTYKKVDLNMEVKVHLGVGDVHISLQCNVLTMQCLPILNYVIFSWCFGQNIDLDNSDDVSKNPKHHAQNASKQCFFLLQIIKNDTRKCQVFLTANYSIKFSNLSSLF